MLKLQRMSLDEVLKCGSSLEMSPPWATTKSFFWVVCACAFPGSAWGSVPAAVSAAALLSSSRRVSSIDLLLRWVGSVRQKLHSGVWRSYRAFREACQACHNPAMTSADVIVIGGGVNGTSTAFNLARLGVRRVTLLERRALAAGATGKSGALVRMHYTNEAESRLAWESLKIFRDFDAAVGGDCGFEAPGFVQIVGAAHAEALAANVAMQQRLGIDTRLVSREELRDIVPGVRADDVGGAAWEPRSGFADPSAPPSPSRRRRGASAPPWRRTARRSASWWRADAWPAWRPRAGASLLPWQWPCRARGRGDSWHPSASTSDSLRIGSKSRSSAGPKGSRVAI